MARSDILDAGIELSLTLDRYAELLRIPTAAFNGLNKPDDELKFACNAIWKQHNRDHLAVYIAMAEERRRQELDFHLSPTYESVDYGYSYPLIISKKHLIEIGEKTTVTISLGEAVSLGTYDDPVVFAIVTTVTEEDEIKVFYPGEDVEIHPSSISISGGTATISIPRGRLVKPSLNDNRDDPLDYYDDSNFLATVDIKRVYYSESAGVKFMWLNPTTGSYMYQTAKPIIEDAEEGIVRCVPATYSGGTWGLTAFLYSGKPYKIRLKCVSGIQQSMNTQLLTARLAHTLMPYKPIDCESVTQYWQNDNTLNPRKVMTPYGDKNGAVEAWVADSRYKKGTGGMFA